MAGAAQLACLLEASAEKPGNVTPTRRFKDMAYEDFLRSAVSLGPVLARAGELGVGQTILAAVLARQAWTPANTNLGIVLLFAPLARAALLDPGRSGLRTGLSRVLAGLTLEDAAEAYAAIRVAAPGGLGQQVDHDIHAAPAVSLLEAMVSAAGRDSIAAEYGSDYRITFERGLPALAAALDAGLPTGRAVVQTYLELLAAVPDTLIARKRGLAMARTVSAGAARVLAAGGILSQAGRRELAAFDEFLRGSGDNSLNPGTTADLTAAALFVAFLEGLLR